jgi:hypothetical protein
MLVVFRSKATDSLHMFEKDAVQLLRLMGATGRVPGGLNPEDVPAALERLEKAIERIKADAHSETPALPADNEDWSAEDDKELDRQPPVDIAVRAVPLLSMLRRAAAARAEATWEAAK